MVQESGGTVAREVTVRALYSVDVSADVFSQEAFIRVTLVAEGAGEAGVSGLHLSGKVVLKLGIVGKEGSTGGTGYYLLIHVATGMLHYL